MQITNRNGEVLLWNFMDLILMCCQAEEDGGYYID